MCAFGCRLFGSKVRVYMEHRVLVWSPDRGFLQHYYRHRGDMTTGDSATTTSATILEFNFVCSPFLLKPFGFSELKPEWRARCAAVRSARALTFARFDFSGHWFQTWAGSSSSLSRQPHHHTSHSSFQWNPELGFNYSARPISCNRDNTVPQEHHHHNNHNLKKKSHAANEV